MRVPLLLAKRIAEIAVIGKSKAFTTKDAKEHKGSRKATLGGIKFAPRGHSSVLLVLPVPCLSCLGVSLLRDG
jgi:hypothetical protein